MKTKEDPPPGASGRPPVRWLVWVAGGALGGAAVMFVVLAPLLTPDSKRRPPPPAESASTPPRAPAQAAETERPRPPPSVTALPIAAREPEAPDPGALSTESGAIDRARRTLAAGNALGAVSFLNEYDEAYPNGALRQDSTALRVEALISAGHPDTARELGERFLRDSPGSPHAARVRTVLGSTGK